MPDDEPLLTEDIHFARAEFINEPRDGEPREQLNHLTAWIDASMVYGFNCHSAIILLSNIYIHIMPKSAGILCYRIKNNTTEFLLVHPGGPYFKNKDDGYWTIPKGLVEDNEAAIQTAKREFAEETGFSVTSELIELKPIKQKGGKWVHAWAFRGDLLDLSKFKSNSFEIEWPPKSGKKVKFPEVDKISWFPTEQALLKINTAQTALISEMLTLVK